MSTYTINPAAIWPWLQLLAGLLLGLATLAGLGRLLWALPAVARDTTTDYKTGHFVFKDVAKLVAFLAGVGIIIGAAVADFLDGRAIAVGGADGLLLYALGTAGLKVYESQQNRKTADETGPLAQPGTADPPAKPELMPQGTNAE